MAAWLEYYSLLLSTPTLSSSLQCAVQGSRAHKSFKRVRNTLLGQSELYRLLHGDLDDRIRLWLSENALRYSSALINERSLLFDAIKDTQENEDDHQYLLTMAICDQKGLFEAPLFQDVIIAPLRRLHAFREEMRARTQEECQAHIEGHQAMLKNLWQAFKTDEFVLESKAWQDLGFQGTSPTTDFRATGLLGLDHFSNFARQDYVDPPRLLEESVSAGPRWYPLALSSISMTNYLVECLRNGTLTYYLLASRALVSQSQQDDQDEGLPLLSPAPDWSSLTDRFHDLHAQLTLAFHQHWVFLCTSEQVAEEHRPTVMAFEQVFKRWQTETSQWLRRGVIGGWWDARGFVRLGDADADRKSRCADQSSLGCWFNLKTA